MELLYNPDLMSEEDIKATFVAREGLIEKLAKIIREQPDGAGVQHVVIIAPRGMGKTTILRMVQFAVEESDLVEKWKVVRFPEERYNVYDLADFWIEVLHHLSTNNEELRLRTEDLQKQFETSELLQEAALALIKDWAKEHKRRLVILVDNFDQILDQIGDERDNARLRDVLMNDGTVMLLGGATTFFREARAYDQPLYNFFRIFNLYDFSYDELVELLLKRAERDGREDFEKTLRDNESRLRSLKYFTGGNPRLALMLYDVIAKSSLTDVRRALEKLLDEVTPYFKAKVESLSPQQRKILDYVASKSAETNEGVSPTSIALGIRMTPNQVSAQLKRLLEDGYVRTANIKGRKTFYSLSEPLFSIWHQMRSGRNSRERRRWLVSILRALYSTREIKSEQDKLNRRFLEYVRDGRVREAKDTLEHKLCLIEAAGPKHGHQEVESVISCYLELQDFESLKSEAQPEILSRLSDDTLKKLWDSGCISEAQFQTSKSQSVLSEKDKMIAEASAEYMLGRMAVSRENPDDQGALEHFTRCTERNPRHHNAWINRAIALSRMDRQDEALGSIERTLTDFPKCYRSLVMKGDLLDLLGKSNEAIASYDAAISIEPKKHTAWCKKSSVLFDLGRYEEAADGAKRLIKIDPKDACAWANRGVALWRLSRYEEALQAYEEAVALDDIVDYKLDLANLLRILDRYDESINLLDTIVAKDPDNDKAWHFRAHAYLDHILGDLNSDDASRSLVEAVHSFKKGNSKNWLEIISASLLLLMKSGKIDFVHEIVIKSSLEKELFPLLRAIEFVQTHDDSLIEKLAPEVKGLVTSIVTDITETPALSKKVVKKKASRSRATVGR